MEFLKQYEVLLKKAIVDLNVAKITHLEFEKGKIELDLETVFFHLQQSSEKALKSILAFNKKHFTKTHDLKILIDAIKENDIEIIMNIDELNYLTDYAVEGRYSIIHDDMHEVEKYTVIVNNLIDFVKNKIGIRD